MKANKILAGLLILLGFGGCVSRGAKSSKVPEQQPEEPVIQIDTAKIEIPDIRMMYGVRRVPFNPDLLPEPQSEQKSGDTTTDTTTTE